MLEVIFFFPWKHPCWRNLPTGHLVAVQTCCKASLGDPVSQSRKRPVTHLHWISCFLDLMHLSSVTSLFGETSCQVTCKSYLFYAWNIWKPIFTQCGNLAGCGIFVEDSVPSVSWRDSTFQCCCREAGFHWDPSSLDVSKLLSSCYKAPLKLATHQHITMLRRHKRGRNVGRDSRGSTSQCHAI